MSGPSGAGKSTVVDRVLEKTPRLIRSVSVTTRPRRPAEEDGRDYFFVSENEFRDMISSGDLLEWAEVHGNLYGTKASFVQEHLSAGNDVLLEIDVQGGLNVRRSRPDALMIFIMPPSLEELERRLRGRGTEGEESIRRRLANAKNEIKSAADYDYSVINDDIDRCAEEIAGLIK